MRKTLGVKVDNDLYNSFISLPGNVSDNLRAAIRMYIRNTVNFKVNHVSKPLNHELVVERVDELILLYFGNSNDSNNNHEGGI